MPSLLLAPFGGEGTILISSFFFSLNVFSVSVCKTSQRLKSISKHSTEVWLWEEVGISALCRFSEAWLLICFPGTEHSILPGVLLSLNRESLWRSKEVMMVNSHLSKWIKHQSSFELANPRFCWIPLVLPGSLGVRSDPRGMGFCDSLKGGFQSKEKRVPPESLTMAHGCQDPRALFSGLLFL